MERAGFQYDNSVLEMLNKYFRAQALEKHPDAMMGLFMERASEEVLGPNYRKSKISLRSLERIRLKVLSQMRRYYGPWINIFGFDKKIRFRTNFEFVYKTDYGRLYGCHPASALSNVFFTSHSLERFEQRAGLDQFPFFKLVFKKYLKTSPTAADFMLMFIALGTEWAEEKEFIFVNCGRGVAVIQRYGSDFFLVKSFLNYEMIEDEVTWYDAFSLAVFSGGKIGKDSNPVEGLTILEGIEDLPYDFYDDAIPLASERLMLF